MGIHQRRQFGQQQPPNGGQVALALKHVGEFCEVRLQPILFGIDVGREPQVANHRVDVVFELGDFSSGVDLDRTGEVAFGDGGRHFGDGAHL